MQHILIIEDDDVIRQELSTMLTNQGYSTSAMPDAHGTEECIQAHPPNLILLDVNLPSMDGFRLCERIREYSDVPIIFVTSRISDMDEIGGMMRGGDDYITKPYNSSVLLAHIAAILRRSGKQRHAETLSHNGLTLYPDKTVMEYDGKQMELTKNELKILAFLMKRPGQVVGRAEIIEFLWDNRLYIDDNALSVHISRLRDKLNELGLHEYIKTKHKQGYLL